MQPTACPGPEKLDAYVLGRLSEAESGAVEEHLAHCPTCEESVQNLDGLDRLFNAAFRKGAVNDPPFLDEPEFHRAVAAVEQFGRDVTGPVDSPAMSNAEKPLEQVGEYRILERLGGGGMATVYKAMHTRLQRIVVLKMLPHERCQDLEWTSRFDREMVAIGSLDDTHIVRVYDGREVDGRRILVMEYVDGLDLGQIVRRLGSLPAADACEIIRQAALGLQAAHERGLVHRDIKPSNLILSVRGEVKVLDLGLACFPGATDVEELTDTNQTLGTVDYIAPEQILDSRRVDIRADIYSLGCTLYKLLTGRSPYGYLLTLHQRMAAHFHAEPVDLRESRDDLPTGLAAVISRMMAKTAAQRYAAPQEVAESLKPFCVGCSLPALIQKAQTTPDTETSNRPVPSTARAAGAATLCRESAEHDASAAPPERPPVSERQVGSGRPEKLKVVPPPPPAAGPSEAVSAPPEKASASPPSPPPAAPPEAGVPQRPRRFSRWLGLAVAAAGVLAVVVWYATAHDRKSVTGHIIGYDSVAATIVVKRMAGSQSQVQQLPVQKGRPDVPLLFHIGEATRIEGPPGNREQFSPQQSKRTVRLQVGQQVEVTYVALAQAAAQSQSQTVQGQQQGGSSSGQAVYEAIAIRILAASPGKED